MSAYLFATLCVIALAIGQILFKASANTLAETGSFLSSKVAIPLLAALLLYAAATIAWVWVLQRIELGRAYPLMALAFVLVPLGSHFAFGEQYPTQYYFGVAIIIAGILLTIKA
ncbi:4-amino-4-deoxy-L-arabinose-phospho-UDP flippase [Aestuariirhabdus litorea]|uniref:4-amino-4-deoxy-L-arabinose-phospho-UDP flippase n=1 Tax=Aestuariirhabdus litorea TaxID=2528527 RepID=A0A3P3VR25_9GAMM|nr:4-amino-4-deoxy-L-arabinose-phospho-UDP flippase [Aestuariirhabdus litorea]RRJ85242.1 4-amino-4-deoxy-L-arabinose-phospho-UDP flippase [Aestuariirhabdus litorea]RWW98463.1 4-amino-4-deoxy-L-arabinose-phospho-UDP flippase [Endozoicomonadaceae bacterium GTF-13]